jgi:hypothetical protein
MHWCCSHGTVRLAAVLFTLHCLPPSWYYSSHRQYCTRGAVHFAAGSLPCSVTMPDDTEVAALYARLEAIVKEAENAEV